MADDLPLTIPVPLIVLMALRTLDEDCGGLDRDEAYLRARLEQAEGDEEMYWALQKAIAEAPD